MIIKFFQSCSGFLLPGLLCLLLSCKKDSDNSSPTTNKLPVFTNPAASPVSDITASSARFAVTISANGGSVITARGVVWNISTAPTVALSTKTSDSSGAGSFVAQLTGLSPNTLYFARPFASNANGTGYGKEFSFSTSGGNDGTVTDVDGNVYNTIAIGNQVWMKENLRTTRYRNSKLIPTAATKEEWENLSGPGYIMLKYPFSNGFTYDNSDSLFGAYYNWYAMVDSAGVCPVGWHVPRIHEIGELVGGASSASEKSSSLRAVTELWQGSNSSTNSSGFSAWPSSRIYGDGGFPGPFTFSMWGSGVLKDGDVVVGMYLDVNTAYSSYPGDKKQGISIRCIKD